MVSENDSAQFSAAPPLSLNGPHLLLPALLDVCDYAVMDPSVQEIDAGLRSLARVIDRYGDAYWPLFERLEKERVRQVSRSRRLSAYLAPSKR